MVAQFSFLNCIAFTEIFDKRIYLFSIQKEKKNQTNPQLKIHTPTNNAKFKNVFPDIGIKDFHKS